MGLQFDSIPILYGFAMAVIDVIVLSSVRLISEKHLETTRLLRYMIAPTLLYALQPWIFYNALNFEGLAITNLLWNVISDLLLSFIGIFYFKEQLGSYKKIGIAASVIAIIFMSLKE